MKKISVILDTDIGTDIDDSWALAMLLKCPELDLKLVTTETGDTTYRANIGPATHELLKTIEKWVEDYDLAKYPGKVYSDGVDALIQMILSSKEPITIIAIGPVPTLAEALKRELAIAKHAKFVGMFGSVRKGYNDKPQIDPEYNVKENITECQRVFTAPWEMTITPLDTCGLIYLKGEKFKNHRDCNDPLIQAVMKSYSIWTKTAFGQERTVSALTESSCLYDTVAVYLAFADKLLEMEKLGIRVDDEGFTRIDSKAKKINCAVNWKDLTAFEDFLVERLTGK
jgi:inosine-uridine nucleoside N-ribohydrolase